jgi:Type VI secretion system (T6SS), amidase effector protein 4
MVANVPKSSTRVKFEADVQRQNWKEAYRHFNYLNMYEMLRAYSDLDTSTRSLFWSKRNETTPGTVSDDPKWPTDWPNALPGELPRMSYAVDVVDKGQMPDNDPPGDLRATGQEEDAREFIALVPEKLAAFTFSVLWNAYPQGGPNAVKQSIGGNVNAGWITNTCAIRISRVLNSNAVPIPGPSAHELDVVSGSDKRWYAYRQKPLQAWFKARFGAPSLILPRPANRRKLWNLQGFIGFDIHFADATGHFDLWDGSVFGTEAEATHDYFALANNVVFWRVRSWTKP